MRIKNSAEVQNLQRLTTANLLLIFAVGSSTASPQSTYSDQQRNTYPPNGQNFATGLNSGAMNLQQNPAQQLHLQPYPNQNQNAAGYYPGSQYPQPQPQYPQPPGGQYPQYPVPPGGQYPSPQYPQRPGYPAGQPGYGWGNRQYDPNNPWGNGANSLVDAKSLVLMAVVSLALSVIMS